MDLALLAWPMSKREPYPATLQTLTLETFSIYLRGKLGISSPMLNEPIPQPLNS